MAWLPFQNYIVTLSTLTRNFVLSITNHFVGTLWNNFSKNVKNLYFFFFFLNIASPTGWFFSDHLLSIFIYQRIQLQNYNSSSIFVPLISSLCLRHEYSKSTNEAFSRLIDDAHAPRSLGAIPWRQRRDSNRGPNDQLYWMRTDALDRSATVDRPKKKMLKIFHWTGSLFIFNYYFFWGGGVDRYTRQFLKGVNHKWRHTNLTRINWELLSSSVG
jgi:hypothetical protein